jgi:hypothetical protein
MAGDLSVALYDSPSIALLSAPVSALLANSINLESVTSGLITMCTPDFPFYFADFFRKEFYRRATFRTNHMMMAAPIVLVLVARDAVMECDFAGQAASSQQFQSSIDSCESDAGISFLDQPVQLVDRKMISRIQKCAQDGVALPRLLETNALQMPKKNPFRFANILPRDS